MKEAKDVDDSGIYVNGVSYIDYFRSADHRGLVIESIYHCFSPEAVRTWRFDVEVEGSGRSCTTLVLLGFILLGTLSFCY